MTAPLLSIRTKPADFEAAIRALAPDTEARLLRVLDAVGAATVEWLASRTTEERGWVTRRLTPKVLAESYSYTVARLEQGGARLTLANTDFTSVFLEAWDGFFVLSGVLDPGGPVEQKLIEVCADIAPEFVVVVRGVRAAPRKKRKTRSKRS